LPRSFYIPRIISGFLLIIFALSITPKQLLHDLFARHADNRPVKSNAAVQLVVDSGYNCDRDHLVAESSFIGGQPVFTFLSFSFFPSYILKNISFTSVYGIYSALRGPPATV